MNEFTRPRLVGQEPDELPDIKITEAQRNTLKSYVVNVEPFHNEHELMFLACAFEDAARRKRAES